MPEDQEQNQEEELQFISQLKLQLEVSGVPDVRASFQEISNAEKEALANVRKLKEAYGGFDGAIKELVKRHKQRAAASSKASKISLSNQKKLTKGYSALTAQVKKFGKEASSAALKLVMPSSMGFALKETLDYNKSLVATSASVNRLGIGVGFLEQSLLRVGRETSLTRQETIKLFDKYQESMRFVSLQQFEDILKRSQSIIGANVQEMGKMQDAITSVSSAYPALAQGLANLGKVGGGMAASEKASLQARVRSLYFIGKIKDSEYKRITAYISGNQQMIGADKARQQEMQSQIAAAQQFKRAWEGTAIVFGKAILPYIETMAGHLQKFQGWISGMNLNATKLALTFGGIFAGAKIGGGMLSALGSRAISGKVPGRKGGLVGLAGKAGGGIMSGLGKLLSRRGGVVGKLGTAMAGAGRAAGGIGMALGAEGTHVFVTNWPMSLAGIGGKDLRSLGGTAKYMKGLLKGGKGGAVGGLKGVVGAGGKLAKLGKGLGIGAVLGIGGWLAKKGGKKLEEGGQIKTGGAVGVGGSLLSVGAMAATGAAIGSIVPVIGTALGGVAGGIIGAVTEWKNLAPSFMKMIGRSDKEKDAEKDVKEKKPFEDIKVALEKSRQKDAKGKLEQQNILDLQESDMRAVQEKGIASVFGEISRSSTAVQKTLRAEREKVDMAIAEEFKASGFSTKIDVDLKGDKLKKNVADAIAAQKSEVEKLQQIIDQRQPEYIKKGDAGKEQKKEDMAAFQAAKDQYEAMQKVETKHEEANKKYKNANIAASAHSARIEQITGLMQKQKDVAEAIGGLYKSQLSKVDALVTRMSIIGDLDAGKAFAEVGTAMDTLTQEMSARRKVLDILEMQKDIGKGAVADEIKRLANSKNIAKSERAIYEEFDKLKLAGMDQLEIEQTMIDQEARLLQLAEERTTAYSKIRDIFADTLKLTQAQATGVGLLVQLADNYAIGVGASVQLRMKEFNAQNEIIGVLKERLKTEQLSYQKSIQSNASAEDNKKLRTTVQETENEILQAQIKQASTVKSMRDAWISAISAMNTGMDGFSEIIMNAEQNTAQIQQLDGAVRSSVSGAYALRDAFGRIIEDVGFLGSERMNVGGQIIGRQGRQLADISYKAGRPIGHDTVKAIEAALRGDTSLAVDKLVSDAARIGEGDPTALAAGANRFTLSVQAAEDSFTSGITEATKVAGKDITEAGAELYTTTKKAARGLESAGKGFSKAGAGYSNVGGIQSIYIGPPKDYGDWAKALEAAPKDTLPRLVVNEKSDAVPVFVVNFKDMEDIKGGVPTAKEVKEKFEVARMKPVKVIDIVSTVAKEVSVLKTGATSVSELVDMGQRLKISDVLEMKGLSNEGKQFLEYMTRAGHVYIEQADVQEGMVRAEEEMAKIKEVAIQRELDGIMEKNRQLFGLAVKRDESLSQGVMPLDIIRSMDELKAGIVKSEKTIETIEAIKDVPVVATSQQGRVGGVAIALEVAAKEKLTKLGLMQTSLESQIANSQGAFNQLGKNIEQYNDFVYKSADVQELAFKKGRERQTARKFLEAGAAGDVGKMLELGYDPYQTGDLPRGDTRMSTEKMGISEGLEDAFYWIQSSAEDMTDIEKYLKKDQEKLTKLLSKQQGATSKKADKYQVDITRLQTDIKDAQEHLVGGKEHIAMVMKGIQTSSKKELAGMRDPYGLEAMLGISQAGGPKQAIEQQKAIGRELEVKKSELEEIKRLSSGLNVVDTMTGIDKVGAIGATVAAPPSPPPPPMMDAGVTTQAHVNFAGLNITIAYDDMAKLAGMVSTLVDAKLNGQEREMAGQTDRYRDPAQAGYA